MTIEQISQYANLAAFGVVILSWVVFAGTILFYRKPGSAPDTKREPRSWLGLALQLAGLAIAAVPRTPYATPFIEGQFPINILLQVISIVFAISSVWLAMSAINELGKQWSLAARLIAGHKLVTTGVYQTVRHPIYTAMLGMLLATGLAVSHWLALAVGLIVFLIGTKIRTNFEEGLLGDAFGQEFKDWKAKVPGLIPFIKI